MDLTAKYHSAAQAEVLELIFDYTGTKSFGTLQIGAPLISRDSYRTTHNNDQWYSWLNDYDLTSLTDTNNEIALYQSYGKFLVNFVIQGTAPSSYLRYSQQIPNYNQIKYPSVAVATVAATAGKGYRTEYCDFINNFVLKLEETSIKCGLRSEGQRLAIGWNMVPILFPLVVTLVFL